MNIIRFLTITPLVLLGGYMNQSHAQNTIGCFSPPPGLISWWPGDNNPLDVAGTNNGVMLDGVTFTNAMVNDGFYFDGISNAVFVPDSTTLKLTNSLTIESWIYVIGLPDATGSDFGLGLILFRGDDRSGLDPYWLGVTAGGNVQFQVDDDVGNVDAVSGAVPTNRFVHVAGTLDGSSGQMTLYVDGQVVATNVTTVRPFADLDSSQNPGVGIGTYQSSAYRAHFHGIIDELRLYSRALSQSEIQQIFYATGGKPELEIESIDMSHLRISRISVTNRTYQMQTRTNLTSNWTDFGLPVLGTGAGTATTNELSGSQGFYQLILLPCSH